MEKTNLSPTETTGWTTWTFDPVDATTEPASTQPPQPSPLDFAMVILPVIRCFPEAYNAMVEAIRQHWPVLVPT